MSFRMHASTMLIAALSVVAGNGSARAGIVNVQSSMAGEEKKGLSGALSGAADWRTGSTNLLVLSGAQVARYRGGKHLVLGVVRGEFGRTGNKRIIAKSFEHLRYRYALDERVLAEAFVQHEYDEFRSLELRALVGFGPKFNVHRGKQLSVAVGVAYMAEYEQLSDVTEPDPGLQHRLSSYSIVAYELEKRIHLIETVYAQPRFADVADFRLLNETRFVVQVTHRTSVTNAFVLAYDARPPTGIGTLDTALKTSLTYSF